MTKDTHIVYQKTVYDTVYVYERSIIYNEDGKAIGVKNEKSLGKYDPVSSKLIPVKSQKKHIPSINRDLSNLTECRHNYNLRKLPKGDYSIRCQFGDYHTGDYSGQVICGRLHVIGDNRYRLCLDYRFRTDAKLYTALYKYGDRHNIAIISSAREEFNG